MEMGDVVVGDGEGAWRGGVEGEEERGESRFAGAGGSD